LLQVSLASFASFVLSDENNILDASKAFVSLALFNILRLPMALLPYMIASFVQASVSLDRLQNYLNESELNSETVTKYEDDPECM
jgi:ABC-type multidrug transport system fused ATPase/permease subunit